MPVICKAKEFKMGTVFYFMLGWMTVILTAMLCVIMIIRLHAMYQRSRKMLVFLVVTCMAIQIAIGVVTIIETFFNHTSGVEYILSGTHMCGYVFEGDALFLTEMPWILTTAWEILALCLAIWIAVKHFRELQRSSTGGAVGDCFTVLIKTHLFYFASFLLVSCLQLSYFSPKILNSTSVTLSETFGVMQLFVLGPRLILGVREFNANPVANSDEGTAMTSIAFQEQGNWDDCEQLPGS
ncbi:hypothetical protein K503DRAFT_780147 [Rhizopogon vinicolor AM-OR11-026]|uniref:Uncharacterized protein n=1 Tax=Rhizopogon vinicolor AM-OR11-026 TaxID=1314800 RepID=A0A1B7NB81_9AGAM|nr:hypothetical protein K503DRAFT_780147 [Rhizopogon vinicolor AM-OR11-026]